MKFKFLNREDFGGGEFIDGRGFFFGWRVLPTALREKETQA
jgi:hypothetical protein